MDPNPLVEKAQRVLRQRKEAVVAEHGIGTPVDPALLVSRGDTPIGAYALDGDQNEVQAAMCAAIVLSDCDTAMVFGDVYVSLTPCEGEAELVRRFAGGDPNVLEAMSVIIVNRTGWTAIAFDLFKYHGKQIEWLAWPDQIYADDHSAIRTEIIALFGQQARRQGPPLVTRGTGLHLLGSKLVPDDGLFVAFALEPGCPCGSGKQFHLCCQIRN